MKQNSMKAKELNTDGFSGALKEKAIKELKGLFWALLIALTIRSLIYQPFSIPSGSMYPTLIIGDFLLVSKFTYGYSRYSFPFATKFFEGRKMASKPKLGDVVVFNNPKDPEDSFLYTRLHLPGEGKDYIKRLVGLPGDRVQVKAGVLHINGESVKLRRIEDYNLVDPDSGRVRVVQQFIETLPNGLEHRILKIAAFGEGPLDDTPEYVVPEGHYFMMGDNRDGSKDSRVQEAVGFVPDERLVGRADALFFSTSAKWYQVTDWFHGLRLGRFFTVIR